MSAARLLSALKRFLAGWRGGGTRVVVRRKSPEPAPLALERAPIDMAKTLRVEDLAARRLSRMRQRVGWIGAGLAAFFLIVAWRAADLAVGDQAIAAVAEPPPVAPAIERGGPRGAIYDRDGELLAANLNFHLLYARPRLVVDPAATAARLRDVLPELDEERLIAQLSADRGEVWLARGLIPAERQAIHLMGLAGIDFREEPGRLYPKRQAAAHVVGYTDTDLNGLSGAERAFNQELAAGAGPVHLSIDLTAQHAVERILRARMARHRAEGAAAILMRVGTGEIIAMASLPDFDPNRFAAEPAEARLNRASQRIYELGSVFKPFTLAAALEAGIADLDTLFDASAPLHVAGHTIHDFHPENRPLTAREVIIHSSNIGAGRMGLELGPDRLRGFLARFGLLDRAPIELVETGAPMPPARWGPSETATVAFGHGLMASPLALTAAYGAIANDGVYTPPTLRRIYGEAAPAGERVLDPAIAAQVRAVMRAVVVEGSGRRADVPGLDVAGKTGTAELVVNGRYTDDRVTTFIAMFPYEAPQYVLTVVLERPQGSAETYGYATAGWIAAPTAGEMIGALASILDLAPAVDAARAERLAALFAPQARTRPGPEEPLPADIVRPAALAAGEG